MKIKFVRFAFFAFFNILFHFFIFFSGVIPFFDLRFLNIVSEWVNPKPTTPFSSTVIVEIDEKSLFYLGQWPWARVISADIIQKISQANPSVLGIDILFPEPDRSSPKEIRDFYKKTFGFNTTITGLPSALDDHDALFAEILANAKVVLPVFATQETLKESCEIKSQLAFSETSSLFGTNHLLCNLPILQNAAQGFGFINASIDKDGILRRQLLALKYKDQIIPSLAISMLSQVDSKINIQTMQTKNALELSFLNKKILTNTHAEVINHLYEKDSFLHLSALDIFLGKADLSVLRGKFVLFGATATGLFDQYVNTQGKIVPGIYMHASFIENLLNERLLYQSDISKQIAFGISIFLGFVLLFLIEKKHYLFCWIFYLSISLISLFVTKYYLLLSLYPSFGYFFVPFSALFFITSLFFALLHYKERKVFIEDLGEAHLATIQSMTMVAKCRDIETGSHITRTKEYVKLLAEYLYFNGFFKKQLSPHIVELMYLAAPLHDIGKVGIPDAILQKPGRLNPQEMELMKQHAIMGKTIIENAMNSYNKTNEFLSIAINIAHTHHEKWDGTGYPQGLKQEQIPLEGRLMAVADVYDALISKRCYKEAMSFEEAQEIIIKGKGSSFDPLIIQAFIALKDDFKETALKHHEFT